MGDEGGRHAPARLAAAGAPDRARTGLGADERRDDQGRDLRARCACSSIGSACCRSGSACSCSALGALSAVGGVLYALFQHELKRLLALHSIENIGIIVLGIGACLLSRARGAEPGRRSRWRRRCCIRSTTRLQGAAVPRRRRLRAGGRTLELDRLGGLLRRMPWTGGAFLVGAMAIAGLPPLNGFASEWLTFRRCCTSRSTASSATGSRGRSRWPRSAATAALAVFCFVKVVGLVAARPAAKRRGRASAPRRRCRCGPRSCVLGGACVGARPRSRACCVGLAGLRSPLAGRRRRSRWRCTCRGQVRCPPSAIALVLAALDGRRSLLRGGRAARAGADLGLRPAGRARARAGRGGLHQAAAARARGGAAARAADRGQSGAGSSQEVAYSGRVPHLLDERLYGRRCGSSLRAAGTPAGCRREASEPTSPT